MNKRCMFATPNLLQWKSDQSLGAVLDDQLLCQAKATRCTQTNWEWLEMSFRWRNARIIEPHFLPISDPVIQSDRKVLEERMVRDLKEVRAMTSHDKIVDTRDLEFDPSAVPAEYNCKSPFGQGRPTSVLRYAIKWKKYVEHKKRPKSFSVSRSSKPSLQGNESGSRPTSFQTETRGSHGQRDSVYNK